MIGTLNMSVERTWWISWVRSPIWTMPRYNHFKEFLSKCNNSMRCTWRAICNGGLLAMVWSFCCVLNSLKSGKYFDNLFVYIIYIYWYYYQEYVHIEFKRNKLPRCKAMILGICIYQSSALSQSKTGSIKLQEDGRDYWLRLKKNFHSVMWIANLTGVSKFPSKKPLGPWEDHCRGGSWRAPTPHILPCWLSTRQLLLLYLFELHFYNTKKNNKLSKNII